jgi:uncharacterized RDD family membrane protein YckC
MSAEKLSATVQTRLVAFLIDTLLVNFVKSIYVYRIANVFLKNKMLAFLLAMKQDLKIEQFNELTPEQLSYFVSSPFFTDVSIFVFSVFFLSMLYNIVCFCLKGATIGQRIMKMHLVSFAGNPPKIYQFFLRTFAIFLPWLMIFIVALQSFLAQYQLSNITIGSIQITLLIYITWYDLVFFTKKKATMHDLISKTMLVFDDSNRQKTFIEKIIPTPREFVDKLKKEFKKQFDKIRELRDDVKKNRKKKDK